jgi:asparagine synthase (glutamine-hydrolysing)
MSVQFGRVNFDGMPSDQHYLQNVSNILTPYGPDGVTAYAKDGLEILRCAFHTTRESRLEIQPHVLPSGAAITWDGRLDNRADLIGEFGEALSSSSSDVAIVATAYERRGLDCFKEFIGDWALSIWNPGDSTVILAKDPIGVRHLYYSLDGARLTWCSILDPLVLFAGSKFKLNEEYVAGWLSFFPAAHRTPYVGIHSVPPSSFVAIKLGMSTTHKYWDFDPDKRIRYRSDAEYEEHFRFVFRESVRRRLRSDRPILAELSGGMDSSSLVCMADGIIASGDGETPRLDTLSYYDDSEPGWNERPYFSKIEERRGQVGCHVDVSSRDSFLSEFETHRFTATPSSGGRPSEPAKQVIQCMASQGGRVLLSGIGGDEVTGGVPTPTPQLADLLARARLRSLAHQLSVWATNKRKPWFQLLFEVTRGFLPQTPVAVPKHRRPAPWLHPNFVNRHQDILIGRGPRLILFGPLPSFQEHLTTLEVLRRQLACSVLPSEPLHEKRYPYLDRDFLEFLYAIPPDQLVRPGQRRSLMRRALVGIVPDELLNRKRKAFVARGPRVAISAHWARLMEISRHMVTNSLGIVDTKAFSEALEHARRGQDVPIIPLIRTIAVEMWLRNLVHWNLLQRGEGELSKQNTGNPEKTIPTAHEVEPSLS